MKIEEEFGNLLNWFPVFHTTNTQGTTFIDDAYDVSIAISSIIKYE